MAQYIGLDVSLKETFISVRENGRRIWRGKCPSDPKLLAEDIRKHAPDAERIVFETGPLSTWYYHELKAAGLPAICYRLLRDSVCAERSGKEQANVEGQVGGR